MIDYPDVPASEKMLGSTYRVVQPGGYADFVPMWINGDWAWLRIATHGDFVAMKMSSKRDSRGWLICQGKCGVSHEYAEPALDGTFVCYGCKAQP